MDDVLLRKSVIIERCIHRINEEYIGKESEFLTNFTIQDSIILNIQRAVQAAVDMAAYKVKQEKLGISESSRSLFEMLSDAKLIPSDLAIRLMKMVGFRNIAVHQYEDLEMEIVRFVIEKGLEDLSVFSQKMIRG